MQVKCDYCDGFGWHQADPHPDCPVCFGSGYLEAFDEPETSVDPIQDQVDRMENEGLASGGEPEEYFTGE